MNGQLFASLEAIRSTRSTDQEDLGELARAFDEIEHQRDKNNQSDPVQGEQIQLLIREVKTLRARLHEAQNKILEEKAMWAHREQSLDEVWNERLTRLSSNPDAVVLPPTELEVNLKQMEKVNADLQHDLLSKTKLLNDSLELCSNLSKEKKTANILTNSHVEQIKELENALREANSGHDTRAMEASLKMAALNERLESCNARYQALSAQKQFDDIEMEKALQKLSSAMTDEENTRTAMELQSQELTKMHQAMNTLRDSASSERQFLREKIEHLTANADNAEAQKNELLQKLESATAAAADDHSAMQHQLSTLLSNIEDLKAEKVSLTDAHESFVKKSQKASMDFLDELNATKKKLTCANEAIKRLKEEHDDALQKEMSLRDVLLERERVVNIEKMQKAESCLRSHEEKLRDAQSSYQHMLENLEDSQAALAASKRRIEDLEKQAGSCESERNRLAVQLQEAEHNFEENLKSVQGLTEEIENKTSLLLTLETEKDELLNLTTELKKSIAFLQEKVEGLSSSLQESVEKCHVLITANEELNRKLQFVSHQSAIQSETHESENKIALGKVKALADQLEERDANLVQARCDLSKFKNLSAELQTQVTEQASLQQKLENQHSASCAEIERLLKELETTKEEICQLQSQLHETASNCAAKEQEWVSIVADMKRLSAEFNNQKISTMDENLRLQTALNDFSITTDPLPWSQGNFTKSKIYAREPAKSQGHAVFDPCSDVNAHLAVLPSLTKSGSESGASESNTGPRRSKSAPPIAEQGQNKRKSETVSDRQMVLLQKKLKAENLNPAEYKSSDSHVAPPPKRVVLALSGFGDKRQKANAEYSTAVKEKFMAIVKKLGGSVSTADDFDEQITHVISPPFSKTLKVLAASLRGKWLMSHKWLLASEAAGQFLEENEYGVQHVDSPFEGKPFYFSASFLRDYKSNAANAKQLIVKFGGGVCVDDSSKAAFVLCGVKEDNTYSCTVLNWENFIKMIPTMDK